MSSGEHDPHQLELMAAAARSGVSFRALPPPARDVVVYSLGGREVPVRKGRVFPSLTREAEQLCDHKQRCKDALTALGVSTPPGICFGSEDATARARLESLLAQHAPLVCKPVDGTHGEGVALGLRTARAVLDHVGRYGGATREWVAEVQVGGADLRIQAVGGVLVAACVRIPAEVVGDGVSSIEALAEARGREVHAQNPRNTLVIDSEALALIEAQGLTRVSVPSPGQRVRLREVANMAQGARAVDVTDALHPEWARVVERIARGVGITVFALDARVTDPGDDPSQGAVLELNARPEWLHHTFSERRQHDIGGALLRACARSERGR